MRDTMGNRHMKVNLNDVYKDIFEVPQGKRKSKFFGYFPYKDEKDYKKKIRDLIEECNSVSGSYDFDKASYIQTLKDYVTSYRRNKDSLIAVYKEFNQHLNDKYGLDIEIEYPPIPTSNVFERLMFIAKYMQDKDHHVKELEDILWQSDRTIADDISRLQEGSDDPIQVCGRPFTISEMDRSMGHIKFGSTAHPMFLTCNLTQVITALEGLRLMSEHVEYAGYAMPMARSMWQQLSEYAQKRVFFVMENLLKKDTTWYKSLDEKEERSYRTEKECCMDGDRVIMYCLKGNEDRVCNIEYKDGDKIEFFTDVRVLQYSEDGITVNVGGKERILAPEKVVRSSFHKENMF